MSTQAELNQLVDKAVAEAKRILPLKCKKRMAEIADEFERLSFFSQFFRGREFVLRLSIGLEILIKAEKALLEMEGKNENHNS